MKLDVLANELRVLRETVDDVISFKYFYHYPQEKALVLLKLFAVPFGKRRRTCGCRLLGIGTLHRKRFSFYACRRAWIARRSKRTAVKLIKNKPIEWATWQEIIRSIRDAHAEIGKTKPAGPGKDEALAFYSGAVSHLEAFKDKYRNLVMHVRENYDEHQADGVMMHVREFMAGLSAKIGENPKPIRWKFR
jgi:hypothetical protein